MGEAEHRGANKKKEGGKASELGSRARDTKMLKDLSDIARTFETQYASKTPKLIKVRRRREIGPNDFGGEGGF